MNPLDDHSHLLTCRGYVVLSREGENRLGTGHPWLFPKHLCTDRLFSGVLEVRNSKGDTLGYGIGSPNSNIRIRMLTYSKKEPDEAWLMSCFKRAFELRQRLFPTRIAYRVVHGEADGLPGVFVDRYGDSWVLQTTCEGANLLEPLLVKTMIQLAEPKTLVRRNDTKTRRQENLP